MNKYPPEKKKQVLATFKTLHGHIGETCMISDIDRQTFTSWMKNDDEFRQGIEDIRQSWIDSAEAVIRKSIEDDDVDTAKWVLARLAKDRGYGDKTEVEHKSLNMPVINIVLGRPEEPKTIDITPVQDLLPPAEDTL